MSTATKQTRRVRLLLEENKYVLVPKWAVDVAVGVDENGNLIIRETEEPFVGQLIGLTYCCGATAKGLSDYIGCRKCYQEVDSYLGAPMREEDIYLRVKGGEK